MSLGDPLRDGEAEAATAPVLGSRSIDTIEAIEDVREGIGGNADAVIGDAEMDVQRVGGEGDGDNSVIRGVFDRIVDQNSDHAPEQGGIAFDGEVGGDLGSEGLMFEIGLGLKVFCDLGGEFGQGDDLGFEVLLHEVGAGDGEQVLKEARGGFALGEDGAERGAILVGCPRAVQGQRRGGEHDGDGGSEVVRDVFGELRESANGGLKPFEQLVPRLGEDLQLIGGFRDSQPSLEIVNADASSFCGHLPDGFEGATAEEKAADG